MSQQGRRYIYLFALLLGILLFGLIITRFWQLGFVVVLIVELILFATR